MKSSKEVQDEVEGPDCEVNVIPTDWKAQELKKEAEWKAKSIKRKAIAREDYQKEFKNLTDEEKAAVNEKVETEMRNYKPRTKK